MSDWLHHVLSAGRILLKNTFEAYMDQYMQSKLDQILQEHHMVSLITQLRGTKDYVCVSVLIYKGINSINSIQSGITDIV